MFEESIYEKWPQIYASGSFSWPKNPKMLALHAKYPTAQRRTLLCLFSTFWTWTSPIQNRLSWAQPVILKFWYLRRRKPRKILQNAAASPLVSAYAESQSRLLTHILVSFLPTLVKNCSLAELAWNKPATSPLFLILVLPFLLEKGLTHVLSNLCPTATGKYLTAL